MSMKTKAAIVISSAAVLLFMAVGGLDGVRASNNDGSYRQLQVYSEVLSRVRSEYVEEPNIPAVTDGALHGLLESLDSNSSYLTPTEFKEYKSNQTEAKGEIGAAVSKRFGYAAVISVIPGGPADKAGIQAGDIFEAIEGKSTREMSLAEIHNLLQGQPGSNLNVAVVRARRAEPQKTVITRDIVNVPPVADKMVEDGIGYIQVDAFNKGKAQEVAAKVRALQKSGAKKLILDLRNCAEGDEVRRHRGRQPVPQSRNHHLSSGPEVSARGVQRGRFQGHHQLAAGGTGEQGHGWTGGSCGGGDSGKCSRRCGRRQDLRRRLGSESDPAATMAPP